MLAGKKDFIEAITRSTSVGQLVYNSLWACVIDSFIFRSMPTVSLPVFGLWFENE